MLIAELRDGVETSLTALFTGSEGVMQSSSIEFERWVVHSRLSPGEALSIAADASNSELRLDPSAAVAYMHAPEKGSRQSGKREILPVDDGEPLR